MILLWHSTCLHFIVRGSGKGGKIFSLVNTVRADLLPQVLPSNPCQTEPRECFHFWFLDICGFCLLLYKELDFPGGTSGKETACQCRIHTRCGSDPWVGKITWRRAWQPTPAFLPGESHGQRSLAGCSSGVTKSQARLKRLSTHKHAQGINVCDHSTFCTFPTEVE